MTRFFTDALNCVENAEASKWVMGATPLFPLTMPCQVSSTVFPNGLTIPRPVTTTRLRDTEFSQKKGTQNYFHNQNFCSEFVTDYLNLMAADLIKEKAVLFRNNTAFVKL